MPRAFLCHASEDKRVVERLARELMASGVDTFLDQWEIRAGDSLRQRIDAGIEGCTDFLVVLSPTSVQKPWVNAELDAGFVRRLSNQVRLIPLRLGLSPAELPPLLRGLRSPSLDEFEQCVQELISTIHGIAIRPELGTAPPTAVTAIPGVGLSPVATHIAEYLVRNSIRGRRGDPQLPVEQLRNLVNVSDDDIGEAVDELEQHGWVEATRALGAGRLGFVGIVPTVKLFVDLDHRLMSWNPRDDAKTVAAEILNSDARSSVVQILDQRLGWGPRRMNPAIAMLVGHGAMDHSNSIDPNYQYYWLSANVRTRKFVG